MPLDVRQHRRKAARHRLHDVERQALASARRDTDIGRAVVVLDIRHEAGKPHAFAHSKPVCQRLAFVERRAPSGQQQHNALGQLRHRLDEHGLMLAAGKLRRVDEHELIVPQRKLTAQPGALGRGRAAEPRKVDAHAVRRHDMPSQAILPRDTLILTVHGQQPVGHWRGHALRRKQNLALQRRRIAVEQVAVHGIHHDWPLLSASHHRKPGEERRERGMHADHVVLLLAQNAAQLYHCGEIARREHALLERDRDIPRNARQLSRTAACRRVHRCALLRQPCQIWLVKRCQMSECRGNIQHLSAVFQTLSHHHQ